ncbi:NAD-dependent epimerase/dehydratase family protein [Bacteroides sp.]
MKKVLVVGANGFLGSRLSIALADQGYQVVALVDKRFSYDSIKGKAGITTQEFVLEEIEALNDNPIFSDIDTLYHFAWAGVNAKARNESEVQVQNVMFGLKVMEFADYHHIKRVIVPGSAAEVSCGDGIITGMETPAPSDMYSTAKVATRYICQTYARQYDIDLIWTLVTSIYGPGRDDNNLISYVIQSLLKGEKPSTTGLEQRWDYLYVDDLIRALVLLGEKGVGGKVYPIGSGEYKQMREYVELIRNLIKDELPLGIGEIAYKNPDKIDNQIMDITELVQDTGFQPLYTFKKGIEIVINGFRNR